MAWCAIILWLLSLVLPVFFAGEEIVWIGAVVLITGWLGTLTFCFAWFANPFFLYAFFMIARGRPVFWSILIALLLSFDSFRFHLLPMGHHHVSVGGYGWGFLSWFLATFVLVIANGFVESSRKDGYYDDYRRWMQGTAIGLVIVAVAVATTSWHTGYFLLDEANPPSVPRSS